VILLRNDGCDVIRAVLCDNHSFVIAGHTDPDGDAVGACMGLGLALHKMGKDVKIVLDAFPGRFDVIPGAHFLCGKEALRIIILLSRMRLRQAR
jgi:phosphoesterase RecJ-like protein